MRSEPVKRPAHVTVYGNDHSPWVQAVLMGLHDAEIAHRLVNAPPLAVFLDSGVLMPVAQLDDGDWIYDSGRILEALGFTDACELRRRSLPSAFLHSASTRTDDAWAFWHRFSFVHDGDPNPWRRAWHHVFRALPVFYFFVVISVLRRRIPRVDAEAIGRDLETLQEELPETTPFFGGDRPDISDYQAFGLVQMFASIPGTPLETLRTNPKLDPLRAWVRVMQTHFSDYDRLYTAQLFEPKTPEKLVATPLERALFWVGAATSWLALPLTLPFVFFYSARVRRKRFLPD